MAYHHQYRVVIPGRRSLLTVSVVLCLTFSTQSSINTRTHKNVREYNTDDSHIVNSVFINIFKICEKINATTIEILFFLPVDIFFTSFHVQLSHSKTNNFLREGLTSSYFVQDLVYQCCLIHNFSCHQRIRIQAHLMLSLFAFL